GLRWGGGSWAPCAIPRGFGDDVYGMSSEPYSASIAFDRELSLQCLEATEKKGYARDLCGYMRNYFGSIILDKFAFGGPFPKHDFIMQTHICCSHAKWYQAAQELEGGVPMFGIDMAPGPYPPFGSEEDLPHRIDYVAGQFLDAIDWIGDVTGREFDDERFLEAAWDEVRTMALWPRVCWLNQAVPAPLDEKSMYALYVLATLDKAWKAIPDFYEELYDEVQDRVDRGIAAVGNESLRVMTDAQPPWGFLGMYRRLEQEGAVSIGSLYTFGLEGIWTYKADDEVLVPREMPRARPQTREEACRMLADWFLNRPLYQATYDPSYKTAMMAAVARQWKVDGIILHLNRGCEGLTVGAPENRLGLQAEGFKVMTYEGNMGDEREFDMTRAYARLETFLDLLRESKTDRQSRSA
ncbi:MAG: benzoyl-CoA reductase, bzd-type, subunit O, partial [Desulfarculaceae bacterium]